MYGHQPGLRRLRFEATEVVRCWHGELHHLCQARSRPPQVRLIAVMATAAALHVSRFHTLNVACSGCSSQAVPD
jgi:hypothetical protein